MHNEEARIPEKEGLEENHVISKFTINYEAIVISNSVVIDKQTNERINQKQFDLVIDVQYEAFEAVEIKWTIQKMMLGHLVIHLANIFITACYNREDQK